MVSRALAVVHTCMYDAWAAYDEHALGTPLRLDAGQAGANGPRFSLYVALLIPWA